MVYVRKKTIEGNDYWYVCKTRREGDKVIQDTLGYLGPCKDISYEEADLMKSKFIEN